MLIPKETMSFLKKCIRRGEKLSFVYRSKYGKESIHICLPIDIDRRMTLYGMLDVQGQQKESCWKIAFMTEIKVAEPKNGYVQDQFGKIKSSLIGDKPSYMQPSDPMTNTLADVATVKGNFKKEFFR